LGLSHRTECHCIKKVVGTIFDTDDKILLQYLFTIVPMKIVAPC